MPYRIDLAWWDHVKGHGSGCCQRRIRRYWNKNPGITDSPRKIARVKKRTKMILTRDEVERLKQLEAAGERRRIRAFNTRVW
jgi:hypothetical protein